MKFKRKIIIIKLRKNKKRTTFKKIRPYYESNLIKTITGIRRCGKSVILSQIIDEIKEYVDNDHIIKIDLESIEGRKIKTCEKGDAGIFFELFFINMNNLI